MKVSVQIEGVEFRMEVETGAAASILYYTDYERYFEYLAVRPSGNINPFLCWCTAGHFRTDCMRRTMAAMPIYARYFPVIFLALFMSTSILVDFSRFYKVSHLEEVTLRVHQSSFFRLKRKLFVLRLVCLWTKIQIEAALSWMPEWKNGQGV